MGAAGRAGFAPQRFTTSHAPARPRRPDDRGGAVVSPQLLPQARRDDLARILRPRGARWCAPPWASATCLTLGKIDIKGRDAGAFLDFVYTNTFSTLPVGKVRYGLMLREDGFVMDDGTTARLGEDHFVMTTTTAAAGQVMRHLDFVHQALRPGWDVRFISVTEHWAQFAVAGPRGARPAERRAGRAHRRRFPFMACGEVTVRACRGGSSASPSRARMGMKSPCPPATARRCSATWWRAPKRWAAAPTGWRR
jgi:methylglutamate dehydrogenase subunit C